LTVVLPLQALLALLTSLRLRWRTSLYYFIGSDTSVSGINGLDTTHINKIIIVPNPNPRLSKMFYVAPITCMLLVTFEPNETY